MQPAELPSFMPVLQHFLENRQEIFKSLNKAAKGRNNRSWRLDSCTNSYFVKEYFNSRQDARNRLKAEYEFLLFCQKQNIGRVPYPLSADFKNNFAIYQWIDGTRPQKATKNGIEDSGAFLADLARNSRYGAHLDFASDACLCPLDHLENAKKRLAKMEKTLQDKQGIYKKAQEFIKFSLKPALEHICRHIDTAAGNNMLSLKLPPDKLLVSPSDFGFHNALFTKNGHIFADFEYAGLDDPVKTVCDYICQPEIPVPENCMEYIASCLTGFNCEKILEFSKLFLPCHRIKWCCIQLNEFMGSGAERRKFAGEMHEYSLEKQLAKAQNYFQTHCI